MAGLGNHPQTPQKSPSRVSRSQKPPSLTECNGCDHTWTGTSACHCSGCHRTFSGVRAFDIHRTGGRCNPPMSMLTEKGEQRLVPVERMYWTGWALPGENPKGELL